MDEWCYNNRYLRNKCIYEEAVIENHMKGSHCIHLRWLGHVQRDNMCRKGVI